VTIAAPNYTERIYDAITIKVSNLRSRQKKLRVGEPYTCPKCLRPRSIKENRITALECGEHCLDIVTVAFLELRELGGARLGQANANRK